LENEKNKKITPISSWGLIDGEKDLIGVWECEGGRFCCCGKVI
jgi:hypothetical protein